MKKIEISLARWCEDNGKNDLLLQQDAKKNEIHAEHVHYRSTKLFFWQCAKGHSWQAAPERRINHKTTECPVCTRKILSDEYNLEVVFPELSKQWDYEKNKKKPNEIFPNENKKYWWRCERNHSWYTSPNSRAGGSRCPYCMGALASPEYNLAVEFPHICEEWDHEKNSKGPETYLPRSEKKVHWRCKLNLNHRWVAAICYRTTGPSMCPECRKETTTSFPEQAIFFYLCQLFSEVKNRYKHTKNCEVDIFIPSLNMAIEYDGLYFHKGEDRKKKDDSKTLLLKENSVHLLRIKEQSKDITSNDDENVIFCIVDQEYDYLENVVIDIVQNINCTYGKNYVIRPNIKRDTPKIMSQYLAIKKENSFAKKLPHLLDEWHYIKNQGLDPELLSYGSGYKVWWVCEKGHEWQSAISKRSAGGGCPFCAGKKVCFDNCLNTINPKATKMWHKSKNGTLTPADVVAGSNKKVWWECKSGHEWEMSVSDANKGRGCPFCAGRRVSKNNALAIYNPAVAYEWNYDKNGELTPQNVSYSSNKKVWWRCEKGHEWEEKVSNRHHGKLGCPFCSNKRVTVNNNLKAVCADIAAQWHNYRNGLLSPEQVMPQSNKKVWWQCEKGHEWEAAVSTRFRGSGCPYCAGKKVDDTNSLAALRPHLVKFWHNIRNGDLTPNSVYYGYTKKVWWVSVKHQPQSAKPQKTIKLLQNEMKNHK